LIFNVQRDDTFDECAKSDHQALFPRLHAYPPNLAGVSKSYEAAQSFDQLGEWLAA
jgi:hypothetical protein